MATDLRCVTQPRAWRRRRSGSQPVITSGLSTARADIAAQLLAEEPFAAHRVGGGEHADLQQLFGRDAGAADTGAEHPRVQERIDVESSD